MKYLLAPIAVTIVVLAGCATIQQPKAQLIGCRPSGADIQLKDEVAKRDVYLCFKSDGSLYWQLGPQKPVDPVADDKSTLKEMKKTLAKVKAKAAAQAKEDAQ